jgi:hypothetical protein
MSDQRGDKWPAILQMMAELDRLEQQQRTLDLYDPSAVDECERRIEALRRKIKRLQL